MSDVDLDKIPATMGDLVVLGHMLAMELALLHSEGPEEGVRNLDEVANKIHELALQSEGRTRILLQAIANSFFASEAP